MYVVLCVTKKTIQLMISSFVLVGRDIDFCLDQINSGGKILSSSQFQYALPLSIIAHNLDLGLIHNIGNVI